MRERSDELQAHKSKEVYMAPDFASSNEDMLKLWYLTILWHNTQQKLSDY